MLYPMLLLLADTCTPLRGGPAQGMCAAPVRLSGTGAAMVELLPAGDAGQQISPELADTIAKALKAYDRKEDLPADLRAAGATTSFCEAWSNVCADKRPLVRWEVPENLVHNRPYLLDDGRVRIEWMRGRKLALLSFMQLRGGEIAAIQTAPASVPTMPVAR